MDGLSVQAANYQPIDCLLVCNLQAMAFRVYSNEFLINTNTSLQMNCTRILSQLRAVNVLY